MSKKTNISASDAFVGDLFATDEVFCGEHQDNPFRGRRIAIIGTFKYDTKILRDRFRRLGADIKSNISSNLHYILIGHNAPEDKVDYTRDVTIRRGYDVRILEENDVENILNGRYDGLYTDKEIKKKLKLNFHYHIEPNLLLMKEDVNPVYEENVYVPSNIKGNRDILAQILGNVGAYANDEITNASDSDKTKPVVILTSETMDKVKSGEGDEITRYIEKIYNESNAIGIDYQFVEEKNLLDWITNRSQQSGDMHTLGLLSKYQDSRS